MLPESGMKSTEICEFGIALHRELVFLPASIVEKNILILKTQLKHESFLLLNFDLGWRMKDKVLRLEDEVENIEEEINKDKD